MKRIGPEDGERADFPRLGTRHILRGEDTGGRFALVEHEIPPRGIPHAFWNPGDEPARLLELISPAGFERYFEELAPHLAGEGPPDLEAMGAIQARYALTMDMDSRESLMKEHGLRP